MFKLAAFLLAVLVSLVCWEQAASQSGSDENTESVNVVILINGNEQNFSIPVGLVGFFTELAKGIIENVPASDIDILECVSDRQLHNCNETSEVCVNLDVDEGNFRCVCREEWVRLELNTSCVPDLCFDSNKICNRTEQKQCNNVEGNLQCVCAPGYHKIGEQCSLTTPCFPNQCPSDSSCSAVSDSEFECTCRVGFNAVVNGTNATVACNDIKECSDNDLNSCDEVNAICTDTEGSYTCACRVGYLGDGINCENINECSNDLNSCDEVNAICTDTEGSYTCACINGYSGDGITCENIDECRAGTHSCSADGLCTDLEPEFSCACKPGFEGDGSNCSDIDECDRQTDNCDDALATCMNERGSFSCTCNIGFEGNGITCSDINECLNVDACHSNANCTNLVGSHTCICKTGFEGNDVACEDIDECAKETDNCNEKATCENTDGSFECECFDGYTGSGANCTDIDECETGVHNCAVPGGLCANTQGSYECTCDQGYLGNGMVCGEKSRSILATFVAIKLSRKKRATTETELFVVAVEKLLEQTIGNGTNVTIAVLNENTTNGETTFDLLISAPPEVKNILMNAVETLEDKNVKDFLLTKIFYPVTVSFKGIIETNETANATCMKLEEFVQNNLTDVASAENATIECTGTSENGKVNFTLMVDGAYAEDVVLPTIFESYSEDVTPNDPVCNDNSCLDGADCSVENSAILCSCNATYFDVDLIDPGENCVSPINEIECGAEKIKVSVYVAYFRRLSLDPTSIHLKDQSCRGVVEGDFVVFDAQFSDCGWEQRHVGNILTYSNEVTNIIDGTIVSKLSFQFPVSCSYSTEIESSPDKNTSAIPVVSSTIIINQATNQGDLEVTVTVYTDSGFQTALPASGDGSIKEVGDFLYIQASHSASSNNYLKLKECWITPTSSRDDSTREELITGSCPSTDPTLAEIISNGDSEKAQIKMSVAQLSGSDTIYVHCDVQVCESQCVQNCTTPSGRRRRRNADSPDVATLGPIYVEEGDPESAGAPSTNVVAVVVGCVAAVLLVICAVFVVQKYRKRMQDPHTTLNMNKMGYSDFLSETGEREDSASANTRQWDY